MKNNNILVYIIILLQNIFCYSIFLPKDAYSGPIAGFPPSLFYNYESVSNSDSDLTYTYSSCYKYKSDYETSIRLHSLDKILSTFFYLNSKLSRISNLRDSNKKQELYEIQQMFTLLIDYLKNERTINPNDDKYCENLTDYLSKHPDNILKKQLLNYSILKIDEKFNSPSQEIEEEINNRDNSIIDTLSVNSIIFELEYKSKPALLELCHTTIEIDPTLNDHILEVTQYKKNEKYKNSCFVKCVEQSSKCSVEAILPLKFKYKFIIKDRNDNLKYTSDPIIFEGQLIEIVY